MNALERDEWLAKRVPNINSTESSALFGLSPYCTEFELWHQKNNGVVVEIEDNDRMKWGRRLEPAIAEGIAEDLDLSVIPFNDYICNGRMGASFDYKILGKTEDAILEIKNVDKFVYLDEWSEEEAPPHIEVQVQHQMEVADIDSCLIVALIGGNDPKTIWRQRDRLMGANLRKKIGAFWQSVDDKNPPLPDFAVDAEFVISMHQSAGVEMLEADEELTLKLQHYDLLNGKAKFYETEKKSAKAEIMELVGDKYNKVVADGLSLSMTMTKDTEPTTITEDMVGQTYGGRKGYRQFRLTKKTGGTKV